MFLVVIDTRYPVIRRPIEYVCRGNNRYRLRIYRCVHVYSRICRLNAEKRVHFNRVIENVRGAGALSPPRGKFHGSENHGVALPPGRCSYIPPSPSPVTPSARTTRACIREYIDRTPLTFESSLCPSMSPLYKPHCPSVYFSLSERNAAVCLHTSRATITRFCRGYRSFGI